MTRKKVDLTYIADDTSRKQIFHRRKKGLTKQLAEITTLCNVDACALIENPSDSNLDVWPSNPEEVTKVLEKFEKVSESETRHKSVNLEGFINLSIEKGEEQSERMMNESKEMLMKELMLGYLRGDMEGLIMNDNTRHDLCMFMDHYVKDLTHHRDVTLKNQNFQVVESSSMAMAPTSMDGLMAPPTMAEAGSSSSINQLQALVFSYQKPIYVTSLANNSLNVPTINSPQPINNFQSIISSNQIPEHVYSLANTSQNAPVINYPQLTNQLQPIISSNQGPEHVNVPASNLLPNSGEEVYIPVMSQYGIYYPHQDQDQQQAFVEEMLKLGEQTGFPWMDNNNQI